MMSTLENLLNEISNDPNFHYLSQDNRKRLTDAMAITRFLEHRLYNLEMGAKYIKNISESSQQGIKWIGFTSPPSRMLIQEHNRYPQCINK